MPKLRARAARMVVALAGLASIAGCAGNRAPSAASAPDYAAIVAAADRSPADREVDVRRRPEQFLAFVGARPGMKVLDIGAGGGYTTELLARAVGPQGIVYAQNTQPRDALVERLKKPSLRNVTAVTRPFDDPVPPEAKSLDIVTMILIYHDVTYMDVDRKAMNRKIFQALRSGGHFVLVDHSAKPGQGTTVGKITHRIEESALRQEVEAAGFRLAADADFLRNPDDPREVPYRNLNVPSDKFVLKFVRP